MALGALSATRLILGRSPSRLFSRRCVVADDPNPDLIARAEDELTQLIEERARLCEEFRQLLRDRLILLENRLVVVENMTAMLDRSRALLPRHLPDAAPVASDMP